MAALDRRALGAAPSISADLDRLTALADADFVINTIQVGGARATQVDFDIPARYGLRYTINDTINVGGVLRGLRTIPVVLGIAADMADVVPGRLFSTTRTRWAMLVRAVDEALSASRWSASATPCTGRWTRWPGTWACRPPRSTPCRPASTTSPWILRLEHRGRDLYPDLAAFVAAGRVPDDDLVRADLFRRFGFYPTESSEHHAEYNPWFIPKGQVG